MTRYLYRELLLLAQTTITLAFGPDAIGVSVTDLFQLTCASKRKIHVDERLILSSPVCNLTQVTKSWVAVALGTGAIIERTSAETARMRGESFTLNLFLGTGEGYRSVSSQPNKRA